MKIGDELPAALWFNNDNPQERTDAERGIRESLDMLAEYDDLELGDITWEVVDPLSPRVPEPPEHFQGDIKCLIGTAKITRIKEKAREVDFVDGLSPQDLANLRRITKDKAVEYGELLSDEEADDLINSIGIEVAVEDTLN